MLDSDSKQFYMIGHRAIGLNQCIVSKVVMLLLGCAIQLIKGSVILMTI